MSTRGSILPIEGVNWVETASLSGSSARILLWKAYWKLTCISAMSSTRATPAGGDTAAHPVLQARYQDDSRLFFEAVFSHRPQGILPSRL